MRRSERPVFAVFVLGYLNALARRIWQNTQTKYEAKYDTTDAHQSDRNDPPAPVTV
ncbi:MAG TPA: hypothetical protein VJS37_03420 [Terriglobales bacterium]|nr:hypothetical protein [Terriglobales bacterium]